MKKLFVLLLAALLILPGCTAADTPETTTAQPSATTPASTETQASVTEAVTVPAPTETQAVLDAPADADPSQPYVLYNAPLPDFHCWVNVDGSWPYWDKEKVLDLSVLKDRCLYAWDVKTKKLSVISEEPILKNVYFMTREHIFYIPEKSPDTLIRTDLKGEHKMEIYKSGGPEICWVHYHGTNPEGKLFLNLDHKKIVSFDISTGKTDVMLEQDYIGNFGYTYHQGLKTFCLWWDGIDGYLWFQNPITGEVKKTSII